MIRVQNCKNEFIQARALLDTCASAHFITEKFAKQLGLPMQSFSVPIGTINSTNSYTKHLVQITFRSTYTDYEKTLTFLTVPSIAEFVPADIFPRDSIKIPRNCRLADPQFHIPRSIDILIGSGATLSMLSIGQIKLSNDNNDLYLQKTQLGWVIAGEIDCEQDSKPVFCNFAELTQAIIKFWNIEEIATSKPQSLEEISCEKHFVENHSRLDNGRYVVRLPFREKASLGDSRSAALRRYHSLERKLNADSSLRQEYSRVMKEYIHLGHMTLASDSSDDGYYLPHHAVIKSSSTTTKVRVVFDASAKSRSGKSLNDILMVGPTIQDKIFDHLIRFRTHRYVLTADIEKMYRQILVHPDDRKFQRIFWRIDDSIQTFELNTVTFGVSSAPFLAIRTIQQLADDEVSNYPIASKIVKRDFYVDDLLTGADTIEEIQVLRDQIIELLKKGGFNIRQWAANNSEALQGLPNDFINSKLTLDKESTLKTLGVSWSSQGDDIIYTVQPISLDRKITKRVILSEIAKIFDPLGLLGPIIMYAKLIMQQTWACKTDWDESVSSELHSIWTNFVTQLDLINNLSVTRYLFIENYVTIQLHGFCDASERGYGACLYIRSEDKIGNVNIQLICSKSRVAPLKKLTIPRLELCSALTLSRLFTEVCQTMSLTSQKIFFWSDSTIVLHWLQTSAHSLQTFVSHRVTEIQERTHITCWKHVRSHDNPADVLSRGQLPSEFLQNQIWFTGPTWLRDKEETWPVGNELLKGELPELKKKICLVANTFDDFIFGRFSSYSKMVRVLAYCLRVCSFNSQENVLTLEKNPAAEKRIIKVNLPSIVKYINPLTVEEKLAAEKKIIKVIQASKFKNEIDLIIKDKDISKSRLACLNPFIDDEGILRVGGRLRNAKLTVSQKCPILLPTHHHVTDLIIRETHENNYHTGIQSTLYAIRYKFWLIDGKQQVRKIVRKCTRCFRFKAESIQYKMADLPSVRVQEARPFLNTGVDYCGPFFIKEKKHRNRSKVKIWICVFVCLSTKAVHLEVVSDLTSEAFLAALRRFISRRGITANIYSDNGTNFVGAQNELKEVFAMLESDEFKEKMNDFAINKNIKWHYSPPLAPHFGGIWEAAVKSFKHHFKRVVGDRLFTYEEINTFAIEIEAILNSRPICSISSDPNDPQALTPAHFLIGEPITMLPEDNVLNVSDNRLSSWRIITKARQAFWKRWHVEYLNELQKRQKWVSKSSNIEKDAIVLIKDKNLPCARWSLGRVIKVHSGDDGVVRTATIRTSKSEITRCVNLLCPLPIK